MQLRLVLAMLSVLVFALPTSAAAQGSMPDNQMCIEAHGGRIWAEPASPTGTIFRFLIPFAS